MKLRYQMRGLGIGIIVTALLMGVVKGEKVPLSDAEIKVRALELGMVESNSMKLSDIPNATAQSQQEEEGSTPEDAVPTGDGSEAPDAGSETASGTEDGSDGGTESGTEDGSDGGAEPDAVDGSNGGTEPGTVDGSGDDGAVSDSGTEQDGGSAPEDSGTPGDGAEGITSGDSNEDIGGTASDMVTLVIESGVTSYNVCQRLAELGLVEDAARFDDYLCDIGYSRRIQYGTYQIPQGATEEEIAKIITRQ